MSADSDRGDVVLKVALLWGLIGCSGFVSAAEEELPDIEFLEYLGSWEESDEEWVLMATATDERAAATRDEKRTDPAPEGEESVETEDES